MNNGATDHNRAAVKLYAKIHKGYVNIDDLAEAIDMLNSKIRPEGGVEIKLMHDKCMFRYSIGIAYEITKMDEIK